MLLTIRFARALLTQAGTDILGKPCNFNVIAASWSTERALMLHPCTTFVLTIVIPTAVKRARVLGTHLRRSWREWGERAR